MVVTIRFRAKCRLVFIKHLANSKTLKMYGRFTMFLDIDEQFAVHHEGEFLTFIHGKNNEVNICVQFLVKVVYIHQKNNFSRLVAILLRCTVSCVISAVKQRRSFIVAFNNTFHLILKLSCLVKIVLQYILPSGIKVQLARNYWGIDVSIYTPKANGIQKGLCTYPGASCGPRLIDTNFGNQQR